MSKINKIVTNYPVSLTNDEVENLSLTLSAVRTAGGGGGGGEGKIYHGEGFVTVNNTSNTISLTTEANEKLNQPIPTKVSDLTDSASYQTVAGMSDYSTKEEVQFVSAGVDYVSANAITAHQSLDDYYTKTQVDSTFASATQLNNYLTTAQYQTDSATFLTAHQSLANYYQKTETSGADQLAVAFGNILDYDVTAAAGIEITTATDNGTTTFGISMTAEPVVTDTNLSGYNGIAAAPDGTKSGWWNVGLTQDMLNVINGKEDILSFSYDGNTITAINTSAVGKEFDGVVTAGSISGDGTTNSPLGLKTSAEQALAAVAGKVSKPTATEVQNDYVVWNKGLGQEWTSFVLAANSWASDFLFDPEDPIVNGNNGLSAGLVPGEVGYVYEVGIATTNMAANKQYAFTTSGWKEVSTPTIPDITANNGLSANGHTIGIDNTNLVADTQYAWTTTGWDAVSTPTIPAITAESGISADGYKIGLTTTAINAITSVSSKVDKPSSLVDKYLVLRTDNNGDVSGWCDFQDQSYSKSEALGTFVATANIDTTTLSGDGKSVSTKLGIKTDVIATRDYVDSSFLPTSGGTVSGEVIVSGGSTFDSQFLKITRENVNGYGRIGLGSSGPLALKVDDANQHTTQVNISPNTTNDQLVQVQHNGNQVGFLIPAVTSTTTAGLTNDGILHIILES